MTRICTYHQPDHHVTVEHINWVDLNPYPVDLDTHRPCYRSTVSTHIPKADVGQFADHINRRGVCRYFGLGMESMESNRHAWFTFTPRYAERPGYLPFTENEASRGMMDLITFLNGEQLPIVYKEDGRGYELGTGGVIKRKWELRPDNVPF